jgi:glyoxylase-like metal-dependent hydrolase (beta-lactamase superfamily II)
MSTSSAQRSERATSIRGICALKTGTGDVHVEHVEGSRLHPLLWIFFGRKRIEGIPISVFVIEHESGLVLFDTGVHPGLMTDPRYWPDAVTRLFMNRIFRFHVSPDDTLSKQLQLAGFAASDVRRAVLSHLHFDHAGGIGDIPQAELLVSAEAWEHMLGPHPEREGVLRRDLEISGANWNQVEFAPTSDTSLAPFSEAHDFIGDGSMLLISTPGHMMGSMSMLVRTDPPILFVGDLCYSEDLMTRNQLPGTGDAALLAKSWEKVRRFKKNNPGLLIVPSHDNDALSRLRAHPLYSEHEHPPGGLAH